MTPLPRVSETHAAVRGALTTRIVRVAALGAAAVVALLLIVAWALAGPAGWSGRSAVPAVLDLAVLGALVGAWAWVRRTRASHAGEREVSGSLEAVAGLGRGEVQGALELERTIPGGLSVALRDRHAREVAGRLGGDVRRLQGELGERLGRAERRVRGALIAGVVLLIGAAVAAPGRTAAAWGGLLRPVALWTGPELPAIQLLPGDIDVPRGSEVEVEVRAPLREQVTLRWQAAGDIERETVLDIGEDEIARYLFSPVDATIRYSVRTPDGASTPEATIVPVDPLFVADVRVRVVYPAYLERGVEELRGEVTELTVPEGSRIEVSGLGSRALSAARLVREDGSEVGLEITESAFEGGWRPTRPGVLRWVFLDTAGDSAVLAPPPLEVALVADEAPYVEFLSPAVDTILPLDLRQPLTIQARDDYGLRTLELVAWRVDALGNEREPRRQALDLGGVGAALVPPVLDLSDWQLVAGDQVRYYAEVRDIHPQARTARTEVFALRMPTADALRRDATSRMLEAAEELDALRERAEASAEATRDLAREQGAPDRAAPDERARAGEEASFDAGEEARGAVEEQSELLAEAQRLADELAALEEALQDAGAADPQLAESLREMQDRLESLGGEEAGDRLQEMMDRLEEAGSEARQRTLEELSADQESFRDRIEDALERLEQAALEQDLRNAADDSERLADQERALSEAMQEGGDAEALAEEQSELITEAQAAAEQMQELAERMAEQGDPEAAQRLEEALAAGEVAEQGMQSAQQLSQQGQQQAAGQQAQKAAEALDEQAEALRQAQEERMREQAEAWQRALRQASEDALALAREQRDARDGVEAASTPQERQAAQAEMSTVMAGAESLAQQMQVASRIAEQDAHTLTSRLGLALERIDDAMYAIEQGDRPRSGAAEAERAIDALNQVALAALAAQRALEQGGESAEASDPMEQLEELAQEQADLNNQAAEMMPMPMPQQSRQQQMEQMAQQQQQIAADLGQMSNQEGEEGPLADLRSLGEEAEAIARELEQGRLEPDLRERQERLFHRLLDAGRSLEKEEESTERESAAVEGFEAGEIAGLGPEALRLARFGLPDAAALNRLPPGMRALVRSYFERLNTTGAGGGR